MPERILAGKYVVQSEIAKGGMGVIYKALDRTLNRVVAIKLVHAHLSGDSSFVERFLREARAMARLQHDNIVTIYDAVEDQGTQLLVMEYFQGSNLRMLTRNQPRLPLRDIVNITHQLASALAFAHARGIIHRDIKPANVMVDKRGKTKLTDFGIAAALDEASITSTGQVIGTPEYMSPEQARGTTLDGRSDLYSVGIILYEMLTGKTPYAETSKTSILGKLAFDQQELPLPFPPGIPSLLQGVVRDLLRRQPEERLPDADTLVTQLHEILYTLPAFPTVLTSREEPPVENAPDKGEPDLPTVLASGGRIEARGTGSMATESTRVPPPTATPRSPAPSDWDKTTVDWDKTTVLPPQPRKSDSSTKPPPSAPPAPPPSPPSLTVSSVRPILLIVVSLVVVALVVGAIYYIALGPESRTVFLEKRLKEREEIMSKREELVRGTAERLSAERQTSECPTLKALLSETYGKLEDSVREVNVVRQELGREPLSAPTRPSELDLACVPVFLEERLKEREEIMSKLEGLVRGTANRLRAERQTSECLTLKALLIETYGKFEDSVQDVNVTRRELGKESLPAPTRPTELNLPCEPPKRPPPPPPPPPPIFPDAQLTSLLEKFRTAYERRDFDTLRTLSRFKEGRERNVEVMFSTYTSFTTSIDNIKQTDNGATAQLILEAAVTVTGETVSFPPISRAFKLQISQQGDSWDKIMW